MRKEMEQFIASDMKTVDIPHHDDVNVLYEWHRLRSPLRLGWNTVIMQLCKWLPLKTKVFFYRHLIGMRIGKNVGIAPEVLIDPFYPELITIEDNVIIGWGTRILCHEFTETHIRFGKVHIKHNALLGAFSTVRAGVTVGEGAVVGMDSLLLKDVPAKELWGGVPAKKIRKLKTPL